MTKAKDHEGREFRSLNAMLEYWGVTRDTYLNRLRRGWSVEEALTKAPFELRDGQEDWRGVPVKDHLGNRYNSVAEMCRHYNISPSAYKSRLKKGMSVEEALTRVKYESVREKVCDHKGQEFESKEAMCKHYGISRNAVLFRLKSGWSLEDSLTKEVVVRGCKDHEGRAFKSIDDLCHYWKISRVSYYRLQKMGLGVKEIMEKLVVTDHKGIRYATKSEMCKEYRMRVQRYEELLERGYTQRQALEGIYQDHYGNCFRTKTMLCEFWGIPTSLYTNRVKMGWSIEKALTTEVERSRSRRTPVEAVDHKGNRFESRKAMLGYWGIRESVFAGRLSHGWSLKDALETPVRKAYSIKDKR